MSLTTKQMETLLKLRAKLDIHDPNFAATEEIRAAFTPAMPKHRSFMKPAELADSEIYAVAGLYLRSWVIPLIDELLGVREFMVYAEDFDGTKIDVRFFHVPNADAAKIEHHTMMTENGWKPHARLIVREM